MIAKAGSEDKRATARRDAEVWLKRRSLRRGAQASDFSRVD
jgi:hypothetical protein